MIQVISVFDILCGECSGEKGMEKNDSLIEIPNKYSVNLNLSLELGGSAVSPLPATSSR